LITFIIQVYNANNYKKKDGYSSRLAVSPTLRLMVLERFLTSDIRGRPNPGYDKELIENIISGQIGCFNHCYTEIKNNLIHINSEYMQVEDLILSPEQLRYIIESWWKLTDAKYEEIIITELDDGAFTLEGRNPKAEKPKSLFSKFFDFILCRKNKT